MQKLLLQVEILLLNFIHRARVIEIVLVYLSRITPLHLLVVLLIVMDALLLERFDNTFQVLLRSSLHFFLRQSFLGNVTVIKVDTMVPILHPEVTADCWHSNNLLVLALCSLLHSVAIVHGIRCDVLQRWLKATTDHNVLLN